jgi:hypothetical protein
MFPVAIFSLCFYWDDLDRIARVPLEVASSVSPTSAFSLKLTCRFASRTHQCVPVPAFTVDQDKGSLEEQTYRKLGASHHIQDVMAAILKTQIELLNKSRNIYHG